MREFRLSILLLSLSNHDNTLEAADLWQAGLKLLKSDETCREGGMQGKVDGAGALVGESGVS
jgi:hypothetical protein